MTSVFITTHRLTIGNLTRTFTFPRIIRDQWLSQGWSFETCVALVFRFVILKTGVFYKGHLYALHILMNIPFQINKDQKPTMVLQISHSALSFATEKHYPTWCNARKYPAGKIIYAFKWVREKGGSVRKKRTKVAGMLYTWGNSKAYRKKKTCLYIPRCCYGNGLI